MAHRTLTTQNEKQKKIRSIRPPGLSQRLTYTEKLPGLPWNRKGCKSEGGWRLYPVYMTMFPVFRKTREFITYRPEYHTGKVCPVRQHQIHLPAALRLRRNDFYRSYPETGCMSSGIDDSFILHKIFLFVKFKIGIYIAR